MMTTQVTPSLRQAIFFKIHIEEVNFKIHIKVEQTCQKILPASPKFKTYTAERMPFIFNILFIYL